MTKEEVQREIEKVIDYYAAQSTFIITEAKRNGIWESGLDANRKLFQEIERERNEKIRLLCSMIDKE